MKSKILLLFSTSIFVNFLFGQELFDPYKVQSVNIQFYNPAYNQILEDRWDIDDKTYELATIIYNTDTIDSVGVRYKGNSSFWWTRETSSPKYPLNIDIDLIHPTQNLKGYNKVKLSNSIFDPTFVRETMGYSLASNYLPTSETGYMNVSINNVLAGLYVSVESVSKPFLLKHFGNKDGAFFKCEPDHHYGETWSIDCDLKWFGYDSTLTDYTSKYEMKSLGGWAELLDMINILNNDIANIHTVLNVDRALWFFAVCAIMPDLDTYNGIYQHNYYLYCNTSSNLFEIIPWDKDNSFGGALINSIMGLGGDASWIYQADPFANETNPDLPLFSQLMTVPLYKDIYTAHMRTIINDIYSFQNIQDMAYGIQDSIVTYAANDPNIFLPFGTGQYFQHNVDNYLVSGGGHWCGITSTVDIRLPYLQAHGEIVKTAPVIESVTQNIQNPLSGEAVIIQTRVTGAISVELMSTINEFPSYFVSLEMFDDGLHGDGQANDSIYAAIVPFQDGWTQVKYYIRASNAEALMLSPQKAEYEFYEYAIGPATITNSLLVINEINYNSSPIFDSGDWIELVNADSASLDIGNWAFKDENNNHSFTIPQNTIVGPGEYLVLCNDTVLFKALYPGIYNYIGNLGFGLSSLGELIRIYNSSGVLIDTVHYNDNTTWPLEANGLGATLELISPSLDNALAISWKASLNHGTPGEQNNTSGIFESSKTDQNVKIYPNPTTGRILIKADRIENIEIYNIHGKNIYKGIENEIDISNNPKGVYIVKVTVANKTIVRKLIKQ